MATWYTDGTVSVVSGSTTVTGTDTAFTTNVRIGTAFQIIGNNEIDYEVINIASDTVLGLSAPYQSTSKTNANYQIKPYQGYIKQSADRLNTITQDLIDGLSIEFGGTGASNVEDAQSNLGIIPSEQIQAEIASAVGTISLEIDNIYSGLGTLSMDLENNVSAVSSLKVLYSASSTQILSNTSAIGTISFNLSEHVDNTSNPHNVTAGQVNAYTKAETDNLISAVSTTSGINPNLIINSAGLINHLGYVSGTTTTVANQYTLDNWRVVVSGQSLVFSTSGNITTFTAPVGGVEQIIDAINIQGGEYTFSYNAGSTATVEIAQSIDNITYTTIIPSGNLYTISAGYYIRVRFISGTFSKPKLELGNVATNWILLSNEEEKLRAQKIASVSFAVNQSWQDVTSTRVAGTTYVNTTGKPILVHITASMSAGSSMYINIDSVPISYYSTASTLARGDVEALIPAGSSYSLTLSGATKTNWYELRS